MTRSKYSITLAMAAAILMGAAATAERESGYEAPASALPGHCCLNPVVASPGDLPTSLRPRQQTPWEVESESRTSGPWKALGLTALGLTGLVVVLSGLSLTRRLRTRDSQQEDGNSQTSREQVAITLKSIGDGVIATDDRGRIEVLNHVATTLTGWTMEESRGKPLDVIYRVVEGKTHQPADDIFHRVLDEGLVIGLADDPLLIRKDGTELPLADAGAPVLDRDGRATGVVIVFRDRSEERAAEQALKQRERHFRLLYEHSPAPYQVLDSEARVLDVNQAWLDLLGYERDDVHGRWFGDFVDSSGDSHFLEGFRKLLKEGRGSTPEQRLKSRRGGSVVVAIEARAIGGLDGSQVTVHCVLNDISLRKDAEKRLVRSESRLQSLVHILQYPESSVREFLDYAIQEAASLTGSETGFLYRYEEPEGRLVLAGSWEAGLRNGNPPAPSDLAPSIKLEDAGLLAEAIQSRKEVMANDLHRPGAYAGGTQQTFHRILVVPILCEERVAAVAVVADKPADYEDEDVLQLTIILEGVWSEAARREAQEALQTIEWMLTPDRRQSRETGFTRGKKRGGSTGGKRPRFIQDAVGSKVLEKIAFEYLELLGTSFMVFEQDGGYAHSGIASEWCRLLDGAKPEPAGTDQDTGNASTPWTCHECRWTEGAGAVVAGGKPREWQCRGHMMNYAVPVSASGQVIGAVSMGYGSPPTDPATVEETAQAYGVDPAALMGASRSHATRPPFIINMAKRRLRGTARHIGAMVERRRAEEALQDSEARYRSLVENAVVGIFLTDGNRFSYVNDRFADMIGYSTQELTHPDFQWDSIFTRESCLEARKFMTEQDMGSDTAPSHTLQVVHRNGQVRDWEFSTSLLGSPDNPAAAGVVRDVTETKQALLAHERLMAAIEQTGDTIVITDVDANIEYVNPTFEKLTGYTRSEVLGRNPRILQSGKQDQAFYREMWDTLTSGNTWRGKMVNKTKDGRLFTEEAVISPVVGESGSIVNYVAVKHDITEELLMSERYHQAQKMESVGRLAGGVAHDYNNMLAIVLGHAEMALGEIDAGHPLHPHLEEIRQSAERSADLTRQLLAFARRQTVSPRVIDLNDAVGSMLRMLRRLIGEDIDLEWLPAPGLWPVRLDPSQLDQILANLCVNARDAIPGVGQITIETANVVLDEAYCAEHTAFVPGQYAMLAVSDTGCGMSREVLDQVFEPFFTTKDVGQGTGLGLATVYGIVKQNHGFINMYSEPDQGTSCKIYLPRHVGRPESIGGEPDAPPARRGQETVLFVEDEPALLNLGKTMLEDLGYKVLAADKPKKALRLAEEHADEIQLLLTDVVMPEMSGRDLATYLQSTQAGLRCLFMSGYSALAVERHGILDDDVHFLQKPFSIRELAAKIREVLD